MIIDYITTSYYRRGYRIGKRIVKSFYSKWSDQFLNSTSIEDTLKDIQEQIFRIGLSSETKLYRDKILLFEAEKERVVDDAQERIINLKKEYQEDRTKLESKTEMLKEDLKKEEQELNTIRNQSTFEAKEEENSEQNINEGNNIVMMCLIKSTHGIFLDSLKNLEADLMRYIYLLFVVVLFAGDYLITYFIFNDILKVQAGSVIVIGDFSVNSAYIFSGIAALVFVVLIDVFIEYIDKKDSTFASYANDIVKYTIAGIGLLLLTAYVLIIIVPAIEGFESRVIDILLRILFVPMIMAVALVIHKIRKGGGFGFLFTPFKIIIIPVVLIIEYFVFVLEWFGRKIMQSSNKSKELEDSSQEQMKHRIISEITGKLNSCENHISQLASDLDSSIQNTENNKNNKISEVNISIDDLLSKIQFLRSGSDEAVVSKLKI